ncbi:MAG: signal peptidase I [Candidatus Cloacimonetes bacterium]|nr:signal peptidase I [Candidatus Cloacimonadota bacterium]
MKLAKFIKNVYVSGFPRDGLIAAFIDDSVEIEYKKLRSNNNIYSNRFSRFRFVLNDGVKVTSIVGEQSHRSVKAKQEEPSKEHIELEGEDANQFVFTAILFRGKNVFKMEVDDNGVTKTWDLVIYHKSVARDWIEGLARAVILIVALNTFVIQGSYIPSASMMNTLIEGDYIWVNKAAYFLQEPQRGDVVVFNFPLDPQRDFIKRLIGKPGDKVKIKDSKLYLNGKLHLEYFTQNDFYSPFSPKDNLMKPIPMEAIFKNSQITYLPEKLHLIQWENGIEMTETAYFSKNLNAKVGDFVDIKDVKRGPFRRPMQILATPGDSIQRVTGGIQTKSGFHPAGSFALFYMEPRQGREFKTAYEMDELTIPENKYFVMGDNRDNSQDSRFWGFVDRTKIKGKAMFIYLPIDRMKMIKNQFGVESK